MCEYTEKIPQRLMQIVHNVKVNSANCSCIIQQCAVTMEKPQVAAMTQLRSDGVRIAQLNMRALRI